MFKKSTDKELANARFEQIVEAIENSDKDAIKAMFSENALQKAEDIDREIEQLLTLFQNGIDSWEQTSAHTSESKHYGSRGKSISSRFYIYVGDEQYRCSILDCIIDTENPEEIGVFSIVVFNVKNDGPGIYAAGVYTDA